MNLDWDYRDMPNSELTVEGIVMPLEGCGENEDPAIVVTPGGQRLHVDGVSRVGGTVHLVVSDPQPGEGAS